LIELIKNITNNNLKVLKVLEFLKRFKCLCL